MDGYNRTLKRLGGYVGILTALITFRAASDGTYPLFSIRSIP